MRRAAHEIARAIPPGGGRELGSIDHLTSGSQDCQGVIAGVGVDADDEWVSMRDDGHSGSGPSYSGTAVRPLVAGAGLGRSHFGAAL